MKQNLHDIIPELSTCFAQTAWMVSGSFICTVIFGIALGVLLRLTAPDGLHPNRPFNSVVGSIVNLFRSIPFLILIVVLIPITRLIAGTAYGPTAAIIPLAIGAIPFYARVVEAALREVAVGKIEAATVMGASTKDIVFKVLLPESLPGLVAGGTLTLVTLIGYSTMAGVIGGGGVGDFAIRYGYQRFNATALWSAVAILVVIVQLVQSIGDAIAHRLAYRRA